MLQTHFVTGFPSSVVLYFIIFAPHSGHIFSATLASFASSLFATTDRGLVPNQTALLF